MDEVRDLLISTVASIGTNGVTAEEVNRAKAIARNRGADIIDLGMGNPDLPAPAHVIEKLKETVGKPPATFEPMVGTWLVAQDGADKVIMVDGRPWVASKDSPTKLLIESARKLYGTSNEELMDNAKQFAYYPVAVLKGVGKILKTVDTAVDQPACLSQVWRLRSQGCPDPVSQ